MVQILILIVFVFLGPWARGQAIDLRAHAMVRGSMEVVDARSLPVELQGMTWVCPCSDGFLLMNDTGRWAWASSDLRSSQVHELTKPSGPNQFPFYQAFCVPRQGIFASSLVLQRTDEGSPWTPGPVPQVWIRCSDKRAVDVSSVLPVGDRTVDRWGVPWPVSSPPYWWDTYGVWLSIAGRWYEWDLDLNGLDEAEWMNAWLRQMPNPPAPRSKWEPRETVWKAIQRFIIAQAKVLNPSLYSVQAWEWSNRQWVRTCDLRVPFPTVPAQARLEEPRPNFLRITGDRRDRVVIVYRMEGRRSGLPEEPGVRRLAFLSFFDVYDLQSCHWVGRSQYISDKLRILAVSLRMVSGDLWITPRHVFRLEVRPETTPPSRSGLQP